MKKNRTQNGFTLIELMVVMLIIAILGAMGIISYGQAIRSARNARRASDMESVRQAIILYRQEQTTNCFPINADTYAELEAPLSGFISDWPLDPRNPTLTYSYTVQAGPVSCPTAVRLTYTREPSTVVNIDIP